MRCSGAAGLAVPRFKFVRQGPDASRPGTWPVSSPRSSSSRSSPRSSSTKPTSAASGSSRTGVAAVNAGAQGHGGRNPGPVPGVGEIGLARRAGRRPRHRPPTAVASDIRGFLICEKVEFEKFGFGTEVLLGIRNTREFGPVLTMGAGGVEVEFLISLYHLLS